MTDTKLTAPKAANRLSKILELTNSAQGIQRFPVDVSKLAIYSAEIFGWKDPITKVEAADLPGFEGCLFPNDAKTNWCLLYNNNLPSQGRIRFTQAHELGHYILHRATKEEFMCTNNDMNNWSDDEKDIEADADKFSSYLLMPADDFRLQIGSSKIDLILLIHCADRYGVSLTAATLKWLSTTSEKAVLIMSNDGFINWSWSSSAAMKAGAFFRTRTQTIELPTGSLAANKAINIERNGVNIHGRIWFQHAEINMSLREMKMVFENYNSIYTLLILPSISDVWPPWENRND